MTVNRKSAIFVPVSLAAGGFLASAALFVVLSLPPGVSAGISGAAQVPDAVPSQKAPIVSSYTMPAANNFLEIVARPLFASDRRPTAQQELTIETMSSELDIRLIGVIVSAGTPIAIVAPRGSKSFARLTLGDRFQGWTVAQIEPQRVTFRRDKAVERIELNYDLPPLRPKKKTKNATTGANSATQNAVAKQLKE